MEDISVFTDKSHIPETDELEEKLGATYPLWQQLHEHVTGKVPKSISEWNYPGKKYGWSYRIKDKKRAIIYFLPRGGYFKVAFVFGQKAYDDIMQSEISGDIKLQLQQAHKYVEGRGITIPVKSSSVFKDIKQLVEIKLRY